MRQKPRAPRPKKKVAESPAPFASAAQAPVEGSPPVPQNPFPIVGVGASAGGLDAFRKFLKALPADTGMAYVLVQHLDPRHESILADLLSKTTRMPVAEVKGDEKVKPDHVYVIPPPYDIAITDGTLKLVPRTRTGGQHMPIDLFMRTLAEVQASKAIGVVLSGTASDGTLGLKAIKAEGGIAFAQEPDSAQYDGMPRSAIASGCVDVVLPPEGIARELTRLGRHPYVASKAPPAPSGPAEEEDAFHTVLVSVKKATGADFSIYKRNTIKRRMARRMAVQRLDSLEDYARYVEANPEEARGLYQDCLISVTSFFRDPHVFQSLTDKVLPRLLENRPRGAPIRVWVPACATGEEVYSIAICLLERAPDLASNPPLQIFATDLSEVALQKARAGIYVDSIVQDVSPARLRRFFAPVDGHYQVSKDVRELCVFAHHNLLKDPPFSRLDLISCRNLLLYLEPHAQKKVVAAFHYALQPDGFLMIGRSESLGGSEMYEPYDRTHRIYFKKADAPRPEMPAAFLDRPEGRRPLPPFIPRAGSRGEIPKEADRLLLARYAPAAVVVDEGLRILEFRGDTHPYLENAHGEASLSLLKMARREIRLQLREAVEEAGRTSAPARRPGIELRHGEKPRTVDIEVTPLKGTPGGKGGLLVLFEEIPAAKARPRAITRPGLPAQKQGEDDQETQRLREELAETVGYVQTLVQEYDAANEELQTSNEEALSANEELQSINEELQTAKEEVQSSNEELVTLNQELQDRNREIAHANDDLLNLLASVAIPMVMVGADLRLRRFTPSAEKLLNLLPSDVGRPLGDLRPKLAIDDLQKEVMQVIETEIDVDREVVDPEGKTYALRIRPYRTSDDTIEGAVVILVDVDDLKRSAERVVAAEQGARKRAEEADHVKDQFVATVSHELRGPLNAMVAWVHVLRAGNVDHATTARGLEALDRSVKAQTRLVEDLLDYSRMVAGKLRLSHRLVDAVPIAEAAIEAVRSAAEAKGIAVRITPGATPALVLGDPDRLEQVLWNLLSNAVKFTPRGGQVDVGMGRVGNELRMTVRDTGSGLSAQFLPYVFERFRQAEGASTRSHGGLGLGLAIVRQLVEMHGGTVWAESPGEGAGATFTVALPIPTLLVEGTASEPAEPPQIKEAAAEKVWPGANRKLLNGVRVLVVEDDEEGRHVVETVLKMCGADVTAAASMDAALQSLDEGLPDVLVSDIGMPGQDGYDLIHRVRSRPPARGGHVPALALTAYASREDREKALLAGFQEHLAKPADPAHLVGKVAALLGRPLRG
jgi:two-component system, chemotaxis family, CheB/CheR fusion protein